MHLSVEEIAECTGGVVTSPSAPGAMATGITWDSREVRPGDLYVALPGDRVDGHDFAEGACRAGAVAVLTSHELEESAMETLHAVSCAVVQVADTALALSDIARRWRGYLQGTVVAITGSSGKTTTKNLVRDVLSAGMDVVATKANQNNELGVPRTLLNADEDTDAVVVEMGMRGRGQIEQLCDFARPDIGVVTNVGTSHIELLGSRDEIARAKGELLESLPAGGFAVVNAADDYAVFLVRELRLQDRGVRIVFFDGSGALEHVHELGIFQNADPFVFADGIRYDDQGRPTFQLHAVHFAEVGLPEVEGSVSCALELRGAHNVSNACSAVAVGLLMGLSLPRCCAALARSVPEQGRQQVAVSPAGVTVVDDSYNANPDSMRASLAMFAAMEVTGRRVAVLGNMGELGDYAQEGHELVGRLAAGAGLDLLVCVGDLGAVIARSAREAGLPAEAVIEVARTSEALGAFAAGLRAGDAVLVKASHSMELNRVVEGLMA